MGLSRSVRSHPKEIDRALERKKRFEANPQRYTHEEA
jgi:hypothetical protein